MVSVLESFISKFKNEKYLNRDVFELIFRLLFSVIFIGLGSEHIFSDNLIQLLMPSWVPMPRLVSLSCGMWLVFWGSFIVFGIKLRMAAIALGIFVFAVTVLVHLPGVFLYPATLPAESQWMWDILQRSNLAKNLCLLGVCAHLLYHQPGKYRLTNFLKTKL